MDDRKTATEEVFLCCFDVRGNALNKWGEKTYFRTGQYAEKACW